MVLIQKFKSLQTKLKNKKGMVTIEYVMSFLIIIVLISFIYDLTLIIVQRDRATNIVQDMTRVVQIQSGVETSKPAYFPNFGNSYLNSETFVRNSRALLEDVGIDPSTVVIEISGTSINGIPLTHLMTENSNIQLKYKTPFTVKVSYRPNFTLWAQFIPGFQASTQTLSSVGLAEYKQDYDQWEGE